MKPNYPQSKKKEDNFLQIVINAIPTRQSKSQNRSVNMCVNRSICHIYHAGQWTTTTASVFA